MSVSHIYLCNMRAKAAHASSYVCNPGELPISVQDELPLFSCAALFSYSGGLPLISYSGEHPWFRTNNYPCFYQRELALLFVLELPSIRAQVKYPNLSIILSPPHAHSLVASNRHFIGPLPLTRRGDQGRPWRTQWHTPIRNTRCIKKTRVTFNFFAHGNECSGLIYPTLQPHAFVCHLATKK